MLRQPNCTTASTKTYDWGGYKKQYQVDGNGRDMFIAYNNGGFTSPTPIGTVAKPGTFYVAQSRPLSRQQFQTTSPSGRKLADVCPVKYQLDGSGRDTYIFSNNGGFAIQEGTKKFIGFQNSFKESLRVYAHPATLPIQVIYGKKYTLNRNLNQSPSRPSRVFGQHTLNRSNSRSAFRVKSRDIFTTRRHTVVPKDNGNFLDVVDQEQKVKDMARRSSNSGLETQL